jgi:tRNA(fMet)-specific endonuclease VapC
MTHLLDTNHCIFIIKNRSAKAWEKLARHPVGAIGISSVTASELWFGVEKSEQKEKNGRALIKFLLPLEIAPYEAEAAERYGKIRAVLEKAGTPIGSLDCLIAAHAVALGVVLVTNNTNEFQRVPGLRLEDWTA